MNVNVNGFAHELFKYTGAKHPNTSKETMQSDIKNIFDRFGINDSNFTIITLALGGSDVAVKSASAYIKKIATKLFEKEERRKERREMLEQNAEKGKERKKSSNESKKRPICFNITELGDLTPEAISGHMARKLKLAGYSEEDLTKPLDQLNVIGLNDQSTNLNISPDAPILEQFVELIKKLYLIHVNEASIDEVKYLSMNDLITHAKDEETTFCHNVDGEHIHGTEDTKEEADVEVSMNADGGKGFEVEHEDPLTEQDEYEIELFGIENITTHAEMEEFRNSEEYELIQNLQSQSLTKNDEE